MNDRDTLDITVWKRGLSRQQLHDDIVKAVKDYSATILTPLPDLLVVRPDQWDIMQFDPDMMQMYESDFMIYYTGENVMEVFVAMPGNKYQRAESMRHYDGDGDKETKILLH